VATTALSSTDAWAVGQSFTDSAGQQSLIEHWNGSAWQIVASSGLDSLNAIAAVSTNDVWAVGGLFNYGVGSHPDKPLVEHWNGSRWSIVAASNTNANAVELTGVAVVAANNVWAVRREDIGAAHTTQALIERWDGNTWQIVSGPTLPQGALGAGLTGVTALSQTDVWAVGAYIASDHTIRALALHWDGAVWTVANSPDTWGALSSVAAHGTHDVRAVGYSSSGDGNQQATLILQWDGSAWHRIAPPTPSGATYSNLTGVMADASGAFWAVGVCHNAAGNRQTLIERCP